MEKHLQWSVYASYFSVLIPICFFFFKKLNLTKRSLVLFGALLVTSALSDLASYMLMKNQIPNNIVGNIYTVLEFLLVSWMYWEFLTKEKQEKKAHIKIAVIVFLFALIIDTLFIGGLFETQNLSLAVSSLALVFFALRFFPVIQNLPVKVPKKLETPVIDAKYMTLYFINMAVLIYFGFNFWLFTISPPLLELFNEQGMFNLWACHNVVNIVKNLLFAGSLYYAGRKDLE